MTLSTFDDVKNPNIRALNRYCVIRNLMKDAGEHEARKYINRIPDKDKSHILLMQAAVKKFGYDVVKGQVIKGVQFTEDEDDENLNS